MNLPELLLRDYKKYGLEELEVYSTLGKSQEIYIGNDRVYYATTRESRVIVVRGSIGRRVASFVVRGVEVSPDYILSKLKSAVQNAPEDPNWPGFPPSTGINKGTLCSDKRVIDVLASGNALKYVADFIGKVKDEAVRRGSLNAVITEGFWGLGTVRYSVVNTNGVDVAVECTDNTLFAWVRSETERGTSDWGLSIENRRFNPDEVFKKIEEEAELFNLFAGSKPVPSGRYDVVLAGSVAGDIILSALVPAFSALNVLENRSPLKGKLDQQILSPMITIYDDPGIPLEDGSRPFDDEGSATSSKILVEKGVLKTYLHSYYTAKRLGIGVPGNGFKRTPELPPTPAPTNLVFERGKESIEELVSQFRRALVVYDVIGEWNSDPVTGLVKATVTHGVLFENGKIVQPVKGVVITGNIYKWLGENLVAVGSDVEISSGIGVPSLAIRGIDVGGV